MSTPVFVPDAGSGRLDEWLSELIDHLDEDWAIPCQRHYTPPNCEGIVWHHEDGRMAKLKGRDFHGVSR